MAVEPGRPPGKEIVASVDVLASVTGPGNDVVIGLTPTQRAGLYLAAGVGVLAAIMFGFVAYAWVCGTPAVPNLPQDGQSAKAAIENYKALAEAGHDGPTKLFDMTVVKVLFPLFGTIIGYIFGSQTKSRDNQ